MSTDAQNSKCRMMALRDAFEQYYCTYNSAPEVILLKREFYGLLEKDRMNTIGWMQPTSMAQFEPRSYRGASIYVAEDFEIETDFAFMSRDEFTYFKERQVLFYRLMTNGEWLSQGKTPEGRIEQLTYEAEGFAEMCSGYERWREMLQEYLKTYPNPPQD